MSLEHILTAPQAGLIDTHFCYFSCISIVSSLLRLLYIIKGVFKGGGSNPTPPKFSDFFEK